MRVLQSDGVADVLAVYKMHSESRCATRIASGTRRIAVSNPLFRLKILNLILEVARSARCARAAGHCYFRS